MANELKNAELCHSNYSLSQQTTGAARRLCIFTSVNRVCSPCLFFFCNFYFILLYNTVLVLPYIVSVLFIPGIGLFEWHFGG